GAGGDHLPTARAAHAAPGELILNGHARLASGALDADGHDFLGERDLKRLLGWTAVQCKLIRNILQASASSPTPSGHPMRRAIPCCISFPRMLRWSTLPHSAPAASRRRA